MTGPLPQVVVIDDPAVATLAGFADATPELLARRLLQKRVDRKFLLSRALLVPFLEALDEDHHLLRAAGHPAATYHTCYFDTVTHAVYDDHRRGRRPRYKIRVRHQMERQLTFLEIKRKGHDERTYKMRLERPFGDDAIAGAVTTNFIEANCPFRVADLHPVLWVSFTRATLLAGHTEERLTLDWNFHIHTNDRLLEWPRVAIVELKQLRYHHDTPAVRSLRQLGVRELSLSKYCLGTALLAPVRSNVFRPLLRALERLSA